MATASPPGPPRPPPRCPRRRASREDARPPVARRHAAPGRTRARHRRARDRGADRRLSRALRRGRRRTTTWISTKPASSSRAIRCRSAACRWAASPNIALTPDFKARITIHVDSSLTPLHEGTIAANQGALADERGQPLRRADARPQQPPGAAARGDAAARATRTKSSTSTSCSTRSTRTTRKGLQEFIQGSAEQYAGAGQDLGEATEYFAPVVRRHRPLLLRARARPVDVHRASWWNRPRR